MELDNPTILMNKAIELINEKIQKVCSTVNVDFSQIENWLIENRSELYQKTEKLFQAINNNIYDKWSEGKAQEFELRAWESVLTQWRESWVESLGEYWQVHQKAK